MASQAERSLIGVFQTSLKLSSPAASPSFHVQRRQCFESGGMRYLDMGGAERVRNPNDPRRAKLPEGPKLGVDATERVPFTYGNVKPHYHVFRQLWSEPTLLKRRFGPKADPTKTSKPVEHVLVPMRKARGSTAVLEALASTVQIESSSVPHDLMDDPYLLPLHQFQLADYRRSKASGRRVAKRIAEDLPYFFDLKFFRPDPLIHSLEPGVADWEHKIKKEGSSQFDDVIRERLTGDRHDLAFLAYEASLAQKAQLSPDVLASLFEIAAFHNLAPDADFDTLRPSEIEETEEQSSKDIIDRNSMSVILSSVNSSRDDEWNPSGIAEDLWRRLPKTDALHCAMVQGLVRHGATQRAYDHFNMMIEDGKVVDLPTFNALLTWHNEIDTEAQISLVQEPGQKYEEEGRREMAEVMVFVKILKVMAERGVRPTTGTFNAILHGLCDQRMPFRRFQAEAVLVEMIDLGLRPTLATFSLMLKSWRSQSRFMIRQLDWLLKIIETSDLQPGLEDDYDENFFPVALQCLGLRDLDLAPEIPELIRRIHFLVSTNPVCRAAATRKYHKFHFFVKESMVLLFRNGHIEDAMQVFSTYVPNFFFPSLGDWAFLMDSVAKVAPISVRHVITIGNVFCQPSAFGNEKSSDAFTSLLNPSAARDEFELASLVSVAGKYFRGYETIQDVQWKKEQREDFTVNGPEAPNPKTKIRITGYAYGNLIFVLSHGDHLDDAIDVFRHYMKEADKVLGSPPVEGVTLLMRRVAKSPNISNAKKGRVLVDALRFLEQVGAKRHLAEGLDLMVEEVTLDATSAVIVTQLKEQVNAKARSPPRSAQY